MIRASLIPRMCSDTKRSRYDPMERKMLDTASTGDRIIVQTAPNAYSRIRLPEQLDLMLRVLLVPLSSGVRQASSPGDGISRTALVVFKLIAGLQKAIGHREMGGIESRHDDEHRREEEERMRLEAAAEREARCHAAVRAAEEEAAWARAMQERLAAEAEWAAEAARAGEVAAEEAYERPSNGGYERRQNDGGGRRRNDGEQKKPQG